MKTRQELEAMLAETRAWLDENEGQGAFEEGVETGWEQALVWALDIT